MRFRYDPKRTVGQNWVGALVAYVVIDGLCAGLGMGVPLFCILLGFSVGWFGALRAWHFVPGKAAAMKRSLRYALLTSLVTLVIMVVLWGRLVPLAFHPYINPTNMGLPLLLYEPKASLIGWLVLMMLVSPFLQFTMTVFGSFVTFLFVFSRWPEGPPPSVR
jgi:hypothetical protein